MTTNKKEPVRAAPAAPSTLDQARDELFSHILRCGVIEADSEQQKAWMDDTMQYIAERYADLSEEQLTLPFGPLPDVRDSIPRAAKSALLEPRELVALAQVLFAFERTRDALAERAHAAPALAENRNFYTFHGAARFIKQRGLWHA